MLVHGTILLPHDIAEALAEVLQSVPEPHAEQPARAGLLHRLGRRRSSAEGPAAPARVMLQPVPPALMRLPITNFGNLTTSDAHHVTEAIRSAAVDWPAPTVRFAGGTALDFPGDWSVWAKLAGDIEGLSTIAYGVTRCVETLGFFVDRRQFRPMLAVATVTPATTGPYLGAVVEALDRFEGEEWSPAVSLTKETFPAGGGAPQTIEVARIEPAG